MSKEAKERVLELLLTGLAAGAVSFIASTGFSTPSARFDDHEKRISSVEVEAKITAVTIGRIDQKLDDLMVGLGVHQRSSYPAGVGRR